MSGEQFTLDGDEIAEATALYEDAFRIAVDLSRGTIDYELLQLFRATYDRSEARRAARRTRS